MISIRESDSRGAASIDWLTSRHTFSFGDYHDAAYMGFGAMRVLNDDVVKGGAGFAPHSHANMEILSFVVSGTLAHRDNQGGGATLREGDVQWMSAGHGIRHSEYNADADTPVHFLQIWIQPDVLNAAPAYADRHFASADRAGRWCLVAAPDGTDGALPIRQDARVFVADLAPARSLEYALTAGRRAWLQVVNGELELNGQRVRAGDGAGIVEELSLRLHATTAASVILFDLP